MAAAGEKARFCDGGVDKEGIAGERVFGGIFLCCVDDIMGLVTVFCPTDFCDL